MQHTKQTVTKETTVSAADESPNVVAYRVGQLENTQKEGFKALAESIGSLDAKLSSLATTAYVDRVVKDAKEENEAALASSDKVSGIAHKSNVARIEKLENIINRIAWIVIGTVLLGVLSAIGLKIYGM